VKPAITVPQKNPWPRFLFAGILLNLLLVAPLWFRFGFEEVCWLAWEAWVLVCTFALLPDRTWAWMIRWPIVAVLLGALILGVSDGATHQVLSRPLNLYFDINLLSASFHLLDGNLGRPVTISIFGAVALLLVGLAVLIARLLRPGLAKSATQRAILSALAFFSLLAGALEIADVRGVPWARTPAWDTLSFQLNQVRETHRAKIEFVEAAPEAPRPAQPLKGLAGVDVLMVFVESYGATLFEQARYREELLPTLRDMEGALLAQGLSTVSGLMESPIRGGQSWLSHATALSGRWIDNQLWYRLLLESHHNTLIDDFSATGHATMAVMPAIIMPWPEGRQLGFDQIFEARDLGYAGPALNWVTMPDQYTLYRFQTQLRPRAPQPLFAQIALISSHAPWTPVIDAVDWDVVGNGEVFERWRDAGEPPQELWQDIEKVREHFGRSVKYSVQVSLDFAEQFMDDNTLMILMGDHQPATLITGHQASDSVPVHVIAANQALLDPFRERGFRNGLIPEDAGSAYRMDQLREWLHESFGD
jgi:hypothetical protein